MDPFSVLHSTHQAWPLPAPISGTMTSQSCPQAKLTQVTLAAPRMHQACDPQPAHAPLQLTCPMQSRFARQWQWEPLLAVFLNLPVWGSLLNTQLGQGGLLLARFPKTQGALVPGSALGRLPVLPDPAGPSPHPKTSVEASWPGLVGDTGGHPHALLVSTNE